MNEAINATQKMIKTQVDAQRILMMGIPFSEYQRVYKDTNENIDGYEANGFRREKECFNCFS